MVMVLDVRDTRTTSRHKSGWQFVAGTRFGVSCYRNVAVGEALVLHPAVLVTVA